MQYDRTLENPMPWGAAALRYLEGVIFEHAFYGHYGVELVHGALHHLKDQIGEVPRACLLVDLTTVESQEPGTRIPGTEIMRRFRELGGDQMAVAVTMPALRMAISSAAFGAGTPVRLFHTRAEALGYLREHAAANAA